MSPDKLTQTKEILKIALPSGMGSLLDILNISIALLFVSRLSTSHIVAFGASMNFIMLFYTISAIFFTGSNAVISRLYGQKSPKLPQAILSLSLSSIIASIPFFGIGYVLYAPYLHWMGLVDQSFELAKIYLQVLIFAFPVLFLKATLGSIFSATSNAKIPFYIKIFSTFFNIVTNYCLIFGFGIIPAMDIYGAALANLLSAYLESILLTICAYKLFKPTGRFELSFIKNALRVGIPTGIERGLTLFSLVLIAKFLLSYGDKVLAGFQIGGRIEAFAFMPGFGFMIASMSLMGQNSRNPQKAKEYTTLCLWISSILMGGLGILMCLIGENLARIFSKDTEIILYAWHYLIAVGLSQIPLIFIFVLDGAFKGAGRSKFTLYINASSIWVLRILPMWLCSKFGLPYWSIFLIIFLETYVRAFIFWIIFYKIKWKIDT